MPPIPLAFIAGGTGEILPTGTPTPTPTITPTPSPTPTPTVAATQLTGVTYTVSSTYTSNSAPTYQYMNDNNANGSTNGGQWGSNGGSLEFIKADLGSSKTITKIVIGYDYLVNLPGGWGPQYAGDKDIETSTDDSTWVSQGKTPLYASTGSTNGLVNITISNVTARYIRIRNSGAGSYLAFLEFQVWGY